MPSIPAAVVLLSLLAPGSPDAPERSFIALRLPEKLESSVGEALDLAFDRLETSPSCRALFEPFHADGLDLLGRTVYRGATMREEQRVCRGAEAFTVLGSAVTGVCRSFSGLPTHRAAEVLIHEALHFAGLPESPVHRGASSSAEISSRVARSCG